MKLCPITLLITVLSCLVTTAAHTAVYEISPDTPLIGVIKHRSLVFADTFAAIARQEGIGYNALLRANPGIDPWLPGEDNNIVLPTALLLPDAPHEGIVINLSEMRLYYFVDERHVVAYPVGVGVQGYDTPIMVTRTIARIKNPSWTPTESIRREYAARGDVLPRKIPSGPDNPMGAYAIQLETPGYFIHGTNRPIGVGQRVSHGCIRLYPEHIETLIEMVANGTQVTVIRQPHKAGLVDGALYLESHADEQVDSSLTAYVREIVRAMGSSKTGVDWDKASNVARAARGLPTRVSF